MWITDNGNIRRTTAGAGSSTAYLAATTGQSFYNVGWVRGRLVAADRQFLYEITAPGGTPISGSALNDAFGNVNWRWTAITESVSKIYVAGYSGLVSQIFWIQPIGNDPSAALGPPVPAGPPMPTGEVINTMIGYLGFLVIGTSKGIRVATEDQAGNLTVGAVTEIPGGVTALWGNDRFVWFSWTNFDDSSTGLGRIDLSVFPPENVSAPAYASDLMATTQGRVTSVRGLRWQNTVLRGG